jgi:phytol kinase
MNELARTVPILGALAGLMLGVRALQARRRVGPELARKIVHAGMGVIALPLPWVFASPWPIWGLATLAVIAFVLVRRVPALAAEVGHVLGSVKRFSLGEIYYPIGVALAFAAAHRTPFVFAGAMTVLAFGDTAGALVGVRWGRLRFAMPGGNKSLEGSAAVLLVSALCTGIALRWSGAELGWSAVLGGLFVGTGVALVEAAAGAGLDNLLLPIAAVGLIETWRARADHAALILGVAIGVMIAFGSLVLGMNRAAGRSRWKNFSAGRAPLTDQSPS